MVGRDCHARSSERRAYQIYPSEGRACRVRPAIVVIHYDSSGTGGTCLSGPLCNTRLSIPRQHGNEQCRLSRELVMPNSQRF
jgi:hypothetical protein